MQFHPGQVVYARKDPKKYYMVKTVKVVTEDVYGNEVSFDKDEILTGDPIAFYKNQIEILKAQILKQEISQSQITYQAN
jgi:hypothetical protein